VTQVEAYQQALLDAERARIRLSLPTTATVSITSIAGGYAWVVTSEWGRTAGGVILFKKGDW
jgi:hypothetical protein